LTQTGKGGSGRARVSRSRGGFSTKIHVLVDALGNPLRFILTSGAAGDNPQALPLLAGQRPQEVLADRGYDADATITSIEQELHATATIPSRRRRTTPRTCDYAAYQERHLVACFIGKRKYFRWVFSRFDKYATRYLAFIHFASICIWLK
jgi:transposase